MNLITGQEYYSELAEKYTKLTQLATYLNLEVREVTKHTFSLKKGNVQLTVIITPKGWLIPTPVTPTKLILYRCISDLRIHFQERGKVMRLKEEVWKEKN